MNATKKKKTLFISCPLWMSSGMSASVHLTVPHLWSASPFNTLWASHVALLRGNLYANGGASCPLSAGARVGFPHSWRLTPSLLCLVPAFNSGLPSGDRGYLSKPVASFLFVQLNQDQSADTVLFHKCQQVPLLLRSLHVNAVITGMTESGFSNTIKVKRRRRKPSHQGPA